VFFKSLCLSLVGACALAYDAGQYTIGLPTPDSHGGRGTVAVLRRDGIMFPFATFDRDDWEVSWPIDLRTIELPLTLDDVSPRWWGPARPDRWRAYLPGGATADVTPRALVPFRAICSRLLGLTTSYKSGLPLPPVPVEPFPKDGLVVGGGVPLEPIEHVRLDSPEASALTTAILEQFNRAEDRTVSGVRVHAGWQHPASPSARRKLPIRLESWYRSPSGEPGWTVSYVEAARVYPARPEDKGCGLETLVSGWVHHHNGVLKKASDLRGRLTYCDRVGATYMLPFGRIRPRERTYWVFQLSGWENEWYDVAEVGREKVRHVIEVYAGGRRACRR
jgi:hypothetical protein